MKRGRTLLVVALIVALLATAGTQKLALMQRRQILKTTTGNSSTTSLANMDSFALALLLGGLRGPLVMFLWMNSESQKQQKDLEGVETQIEWIRLLQPEFDTVHLFQIWNKAYNISAQMASVANKYSVILDALRYARNVESQRPDNLNILMTEANIYNDKLAGSAEKYYYRKRVREDTKYRAPDRIDQMEAARPTRHPSLLQPDGMFRPELLVPHLTQEAGKQGEFYDGSEMQFLKTHQPFPYGVPAYALAYNYFKRSQTLQRETGQQHIQISAMVIDSRPALCLRVWFEEEWDLAIRREAEMFGKPVAIDRIDAVHDSAAFNPLSLTQEQLKSGAAAYDEAVYRYSYALRLMDDADAAYRAHLAIPDYQMHIEMYRSHLEHIAGCKFIVAGDLAMLQASRAAGEEKSRLIASAKEAYRQSIRLFRINRLRYYTSEQDQVAVLPKGMNRWQLEKATDEQLESFVTEVDRRLAAEKFDYFEDDTHEHKAYIEHAIRRIAAL